jgi:hypothetical protein
LHRRNERFDRGASARLAEPFDNLGARDRLATVKHCATEGTVLEAPKLARGTVVLPRLDLITAHIA